MIILSGNFKHFEKKNTHKNKKISHEKETFCQQTFCNITISYCGYDEGTPPGVQGVHCKPFLFPKQSAHLKNIAKYIYQKKFFFLNKTKKDAIAKHAKKSLRTTLFYYGKN